MHYWDTEGDEDVGSHQEGYWGERDLEGGYSPFYLDLLAGFWCGLAEMDEGHTNSAPLPEGWVRVPGRNVAMRFANQDLGRDWLGTLGSRLYDVSSTKIKTRTIAAPTGPNVHQKTYCHGCVWAMKPPSVPPPMTAKMMRTSKIAKALPR